MAAPLVASQAATKGRLAQQSRLQLALEEALGSLEAEGLLASQAATCIRRVAGEALRRDAGRWPELRLGGRLAGYRALRGEWTMHLDKVNVQVVPEHPSRGVCGASRQIRRLKVIGSEVVI
ncbi:unnamed protein product [Polarella glacialis]|uniref:Uncharacterized protein n=2 Tax=Polarella glacialis TaxID=89957 RepID=A0A813EI79_POLGL|nr:unnamed protein product [Polarella glacialis]